MREVSVLWVDDEWSEVPSASEELPQAKAALELALVELGLKVRINCRKDGDIWNDLTDETRVDLLILDYELTKHSPGHNAFDLLNKLSALRSMPPVILFTHYARHQLKEVEHVRAKRRIHAVFFKDKRGIKDLVECAASLLGSTPIGLVVMSDLHVGYLDETRGISQHRFLESLYDSLDTVVKNCKVNGLICCGDFAWKQQAPELVQSYKMIQGITGKLGLKTQDEIFFCPGNHDITFSSSNGPSWSSFGEFVGLLAGPYRDIEKRFEHSSKPMGGRQRFHDQASLFSVLHNERLGIVVVGLNSNRPTGNGVQVDPFVDEGQWCALSEALSRYPKELLRIAILHHPVFSAPGGVHEDEQALADQGKALQILTGAGVRLVFHGHAHFSAVHSHRIAIVNSPESLNGSGGGKAADLLTVACPSLVANPSSASPHRQYLVVQLGGADPDTGARSFALHSMVFNPGKCSWDYGEAILPGQFFVGPFN
ncbi:metallophosphoesterase [Tahibacter soli]|uniref:Metallophosphoesterase n=1 Tax=Tahibacter soli TaxID=2983605 RepID=A0A9X3YJW8_9GAMM|nr:metallophosphoesterase [Tahibacter soli]MDC8012595.1 metallophosphoesterase [Tahibacter soli]